MPIRLFVAESVVDFSVLLVLLIGDVEERHFLEVAEDLLGDVGTQPVQDQLINVKDEPVLFPLFVRKITTRSGGVISLACLPSCST